MDLAKNILESIIDKNIAVKSMISGYKAADIWNEVIDKNNVSWVDKFSKGTLYIYSENPSFIQDVIFRKNTIINKLNAELNTAAIKDIKGRISCQKKAIIMPQR